jgi:hypothetical protein
MYVLNIEIFQWHHPDLNAPLDVSIGFDSVTRYDRQAHRDYETIEPYIEAVYIGNVDIMPIMGDDDLDSILNDYKDSKK